MIVEGESIGDYDARNATEAEKVCGDINTARWHLRRGLKPSELDEACSLAYRAFHRQNGAVRTRVRQRTLAALKDAHLEEFAALRDHHRIEIDFHSIAAGETVRASILANRARQRAMNDLAKKYRLEYQRIYTEKMFQALMEES